MRSRKTVWLLLVVAFAFSASALAKTDKEKDYAVPAFSDLSVLTPQMNPSLGINPVNQELSAGFSVEEVKRFDINRDTQLNEFDVKQFQSIIESLNGEKLTGLELSARFRSAQKNQRESFLVLYDLDRDGLFTSKDVELFTNAIQTIDTGATSGKDLIEKFRMRVFPPLRGEGK